MTRARSPKYVLYIDLASEEKEVTVDGGIDFKSNPPMAPKYINNIKLPLFDQQRLILRPLQLLEKRGHIKSYLPPFKAASEEAQSLLGVSVKKLGRFQSDAWEIYLAVGAGKTLIALSLVGGSRVPDRRRVINGADMSHAILCSTPLEIEEFPRKNPTDLARIADSPWYFEDDIPTFPSITPKAIDSTILSEHEIIPTSLLFAAPHLLEQMAGYCKEQVSYPWKMLPDLKAFSEFLIEACINPEETFKDLWLLILPAITCHRSDTIHIEACATEAREALRKKDGDFTRELGRIDKMLKVILERNNDLPSSDFFTAYCGSFGTTKYFARAMFDDYDTLQLRGAAKIPAISYVYISGTSMSRPNCKFSFANKPVFMSYARTAMRISADPEGVVKVMGLEDPSESVVICTEGLSRRSFVVMLKILVELLTLYRGMALTRFRIPAPTNDNPTKTKPDPNVEPYDRLPERYRGIKNPLDLLIEDTEKALHADSLTTVLGLVRYMSDAGSVVGLTILPSDYMTGPLPKHFTFSTLSAILSRKVYSERMRLNVCHLSIQALSEIFKDGGTIRSEHKIMTTALANYTKLFSFPPCNKPFKEVATVSKEPMFGLRDLALAKPPIAPFKDLWAFIMNGPGGTQQLYKYFEFLSPYFLWGIVKGKTFGDIDVDFDECIPELNKAEECVAGIEKSLNSLLNSKEGRETVESNCATCNKGSGDALITCCCSSIVCLGCLPDTFGKKYKTVKCRLCRTDVTNARLIAVPTHASPVGSCRQIGKTFGEIGPALATAAKVSDSERVMDVISTIRYFYLPLCTSTIINLLPTIVDEPMFAMGASSALLDKTKTVCAFIQRLKDTSPDKAVKVLIYHHYEDVNEGLVKALGEIDVIAEPFLHSNGTRYRNSDKSMVIIANHVRGIGGIHGFDMSYLDAIIFYTPPMSTEDKIQLIGRAQRTGRGLKHKLQVLTLYYPKEINDPQFKGQRLDEIDLWKTRPKGRPPTVAPPATTTPPPATTPPPPATTPPPPATTPPPSPPIATTPMPIPSKEKEVSEESVVAVTTPPSADARIEPKETIGKSVKVKKTVARLPKGLNM